MAKKVKKYRLVKTFSISGKGNNIFRSEDEFTADQLPEGAFEKYFAEGCLEEVKGETATEKKARLADEAAAKVIADEAAAKVIADEAAAKVIADEAAAKVIADEAAAKVIADEAAAKVIADEAAAKVIADEAAAKVIADESAAKVIADESAYSKSLKDRLAPLNTFEAIKNEFTYGEVQDLFKLLELTADDKSENTLVNAILTTKN